MCLSAVILLKEADEVVKGEGPWEEGGKFERLEPSPALVVHPRLDAADVVTKGKE